jgi:soluble lytic murein transglycosylase-like protein
MNRNLCLATLLVALASASAASAQNLDANGNLDALIARHAAANNVPPDLVRRVIKRESGGNPRTVSQGNYGLMQIKLGTARSMGYRGTAAGLLDADTNMTYAVKYLAGAYQAAGGNPNGAVHNYAAGYYAKGRRHEETMTVASLPFNAFAFAPAAAAAPAVGPVASAPVAPKKKLREAQAAESVSSSSNPYTGQIDYH